MAAYDRDSWSTMVNSGHFEDKIRNMQYWAHLGPELLLNLPVISKSLDFWPHFWTRPTQIDLIWPNLTLKHYLSGSTNKNDCFCGHIFLCFISLVPLLSIQRVWFRAANNVWHCLRSLFLRLHSLFLLSEPQIELFYVLMVLFLS